MNLVSVPLRSCHQFSLLTSCVHTPASRRSYSGPLLIRSCDPISEQTLHVGNDSSLTTSVFSRVNEVDSVDIPYPGGQRIDPLISFRNRWAATQAQCLSMAGASAMYNIRTFVCRQWPAKHRSVSTVGTWLQCRPSGHAAPIPAFVFR